MKSSSPILFFLVVGLAFVFTTELLWSYDDSQPGGPSNWSFVSPFCEGHQQSPINFVSGEFCDSPNATKISILHINKKPNSIIFGNNGNGITVAFNFTDPPPKITGGPLGDKEFSFHRFHVHWPSEHTLNSKNFDAELQLVFHNPLFHPFEAQNNPDGLVIFGFFMNVNSSESLDFETVRPFLYNLQHVFEVGDSFNETQDVFSLHKMLRRKTFSVWSYDGSLTFPDCRETVKWLVNRTPLSMHTSELQLLSMIKDHRGEMLVSNARPVQERSNRKIKCFS